MSESKQQWLERVADLHGLDPEDIEEIAELCIEDTEEHINTLKDINSQDLEVAIRAAHSIKGSAANIGQAQLSMAAKTIEGQLRQENLTDIEHNVNVLQKAYEQFQQLMQS